MGEGGRDEEVASSKKNRACKNRFPIYDQEGGKMAKIDTLFMNERRGEVAAPLEFLIANKTDLSNTWRALYPLT